MSRIMRLVVFSILIAIFIFSNVGGPMAQAAPATIKVKLFFVILEDAGKTGKKIGCDDSIVPVTAEIPRTVTPLRDALNKLFSIKQETISAGSGNGPELTNTLHDSTLKVGSISVHNGVLKVTLSGQLSLAGECDDPRVQAQIEETALQYSTINSLPVKSVKIFLNGKPLDSFLGGQGAATALAAVVVMEKGER